ncbi:MULTISPECIES: hypothetical protein [Streptomyces]|uniref:hypothetical protein n=1 Tax=Streptomyces TaxID=1883 RepID=UPI00365ED5FA
MTRIPSTPARNTCGVGLVVAPPAAVGIALVCAGVLALARAGDDAPWLQVAVHR